ncbi:MAG: DUF2793 domain-containing protein [Alphaproteobacteria bacterium]|nr:DUF2793 domain-containing protein [Alphaproteobacteria bacterium]
MTDLPDTSPNLGLPFYLTKQNEFEVQHNEALLILDALVMLSVLDRDLASPPAEPALGDRYIVASPGTGAFAGKDNRIAQYDVGGWNFYAPQEGWTCYVRDESALLAWDGESWAPAIDALGEVTELQNLNRLGVGTEADATNRFAAKLNNALWVARTDAEGGDGDLRYKLSKESAGNTLSMLFQTDFEGRAEIGLTGNDDFRFKVSADGETWLDAIVIDHATGEVTMPQTAPAGAPADLDVTLAGLALGIADALNVAQFMGAAGNRFADSFDALTYVNVAGATGLDTGTAGLLKPAVSGGLISQGAGSVIGGTNGSAWSNTGAAFDGNTSQTRLVGANSDNATVAYIGKDYGGSPKTVTGFKVWGSSDEGFKQASDPTIAVQLYGKNGSAPGSSTDGTLLGSASNTDANSLLLQNLAISNSTAYQYVWLRIDAPNSNRICVAEAEFYESAGSGGMTVASTALTAAAEPVSMKIVSRVKFVDEIALGDDLIFEVSRDGGTTWTEAAMNDRFTWGDLHVLESDPVDLSAQPSGTSVKWRIAIANDKAAEVRDIYLYWA